MDADIGITERISSGEVFTSVIKRLYVLLTSG